MPHEKKENIEAATDDAKLPVQRRVMSNDLFAGTKHQKQRKPRRVMAHVADAGIDAILFRCKCGWESGWLVNDMAVSDAKKGIPCEICNS